METNKEAIDPTKCWQEIIDKNKTLVIPCYQRGYIWGKKSEKRPTDAVTFMLNSIKDCKDKLFIQGITVYENEQEIYLIDGQQRATFFYLLLRCLGNTQIKLRYTGIRDSQAIKDNDPIDHPTPQEWISSFNNDTDCSDNQEESYQDIFFFKKTVRAIKNTASEIDIDLVLKRIRFMWINISREQQLVSFRMMNGNKEDMKPHELLKADLLRRASSGTGGYQDKIAQEWDNIILRRTYALAWDKWLYWWNDESVRNMYRLFNTDFNQLGRLLPFTFLNTVESSSNVFEGWKDLMKNAEDARDSKSIFYDLRCNQIKFEEAYGNAELYNLIGTVLCLLDNKKDKEQSEKNKTHFLYEYFKTKRIPILEDLNLVVNLLLFHIPLKDILNNGILNQNDLMENETAENLKKAPVFEVCKEDGYRYLLVRNVEKDTDLKRRFDFSIWNDNRSLEHVVPKSKVFHKKAETGELLTWEGKPIGENNKLHDKLLTREDIKAEQTSGKYTNNEFLEATITEHSIGNLLLLYGANNSSFGDKDPKDKRKEYFDTKSQGFSSRNLLHTMFTFCRFENVFGAREICENQLDVINDINCRIKYIINRLNILKDEKA